MRNDAWIADLVSLQFATVRVEDGVLFQRARSAMPVQRDAEAGDAMGVLGDEGDVVADQDNRDALCGKLAQNDAELPLTFGIDPGCWLVEQEGGRRIHQRPREQTPALLAA